MMAMMPPQGMMAPEQSMMPEQEMAPSKSMAVNPEEFSMALQNASEETIQTLEQHLTPPLKAAFGELFGTEITNMLNNFGPDQPTINIPVSVIATAYPSESIQDSISLMKDDLASKAQNDIPRPPTGGLGEPPATPAEDSQTNVPPSMPMMA